MYFKSSKLGHLPHSGWPQLAGHELPAGIGDGGGRTLSLPPVKHDGREGGLGEAQLQV